MKGRRGLSFVLALWLVLCTTANAFGAEPAESAVPTAGYSAGVEEPQSPEPEAEETPEDADAEPSTPLILEQPAGAITPANLQQSDETPEPPADTEDPFVVTSEEELLDWVDNHRTTGGTVTLGANVTIKELTIMIFSGTGITIDTGEYGLVLDGGVLITGDNLITGEGVDTPVVTVLNIDKEQYSSDSWNNALLEMHITATGLNGKGGTALRISGVDTNLLRMSSLSEQGIIRSDGEGAIGLWLDSPMEAWGYRIEVSGANSKAVYAPEGADLYYCKLTAEGDSAQSVAGSNLMLDSCAASPSPTSAQITTRSAMQESFSRLYLPLEQNTRDSNEIMMLNTPAVLLRDQDGSITSQRLQVDWDMDAYYNNVDTDVLGKTKIEGTLSPALYGLGVFDAISVELLVEVRDPNIPCISNLTMRELEGARYARFNFWKSYDPEDETVILWRSDNEGKTWKKVTHSPDIVWNDRSADFFYSDLQHPVWFQLEEVGVGESNIAILDIRDGVFVGGNGGDRTGTDREGVRPPFGSTNGNTSVDDDREEGTDYTKQETNADTIVLVPAEVPESALVIQNIPVWKPATADTLTQTAPAEEKPETTQAQPATTAPQTALVPDNENQPTEAEAPFDSEQSAPQPEFSATAFAIFFLAVAGLCSGALLAFRFGKRGRWQREKP